MTPRSHLDDVHGPVRIATLAAPTGSHRRRLQLDTLTGTAGNSHFDGSSSPTRKWVARLVAAFATALLGPGGAAFAQPAPLEENRILVIGGEEISFELLTDRFAVRFREEISDTEREAVEQRHPLLSATRADAPLLSTGLSLRELSQPLPTTEFQATILQLRQDRDIAFVTPAYEWDGIVVLPTNQVFVQLDEGVSPGRLTALREQFGLALLRETSWKAGNNVFSLASDAPLDVFETCTQLAAEAGVAFAEPNFALLIEPLHWTDDPQFWYQGNLIQPASDNDIDAPEGWEIQEGCADVTIAILDDGVQRNHPDFDPALMLQGRDFALDIPDDDPTPNPWDGHGTACAGIAAAWSNNAQGIAGVASGARILPVRIARSWFPGGWWDTTTEKLANSIAWAYLNGADVLSNSWRTIPSSQVREAIRGAVRDGRGGRGAVVVFASGNEYLSSLAYPARLSETIAVGATDPTDQRASFSNYGAGLDCVAPGTDIWTTDLTGSDGYVGPNDPYSSDNGNYFEKFGGTSAAAPHVAGLAALLICEYPTYEGTEIRARIQQTCDQIAGYSFDPVSGINDELGYGRINVYRALSGKPQVDLDPADSQQPSIFYDYSDDPGYPATHHESAEYEWLGLDYSPERNQSDADDPDGKANFQTDHGADGFDDGVIFYPPYRPGEIGKVDVEVCVENSNSTRYGPLWSPLYLNIWIDWQSDGDFNNQHDRVLTNMVVDPSSWGGANCRTIQVTFLVPDLPIDWHIQGDAPGLFLNARTRVSWPGPPSDAYQTAESGEVEDDRILNFVEMFAHDEGYMEVQETCQVWNHYDGSEPWTCAPPFRPDSSPTNYMCAEIYHSDYLGDDAARLRTPSFDLSELTEAHLEFEHCGVEMVTGYVRVVVTDTTGLVTIDTLRTYYDPLAQPPCGPVLQERIPLVQYCGDGFEDVVIEFLSYWNQSCPIPIPDYQDWKIDNVVVWGADRIAPGPASATVTPLGPGTRQLVWDTPGDDGAMRQAELFNIRFGVEPIDASNWRHSIWVEPSMLAAAFPVPGAPRTPVTLDVNQLASNMQYFNVRTLDEVTHHGPIQNDGVNHPPVLTAPDTVTVQEWDDISFDIAASDLDFDALTLFAMAMPADAGFDDRGDGTGEFTWQTGSGDAGDHLVIFEARDWSGLSDRDTTVVRVGTSSPVAGACCLPDDCCVVSTATLCGNQGGGFQGVGSDCEPNPCGPALPAYANHDVGDAVLTVTDQGIVGFMDGTQAEGAGFVYPSGGTNQLYIGGLWIGETSGYVANRDFDADPAKEWEVSLCPDGRIHTDLQGGKQTHWSSYTDRGAGGTGSLRVEQESWAFSSPASDDDFVIVRVILENTGSATFTDLYVGMMLDLDMEGDGTNNTGGTDSSRQLAWCAAPSGTHAGVLLLDSITAGLPVGNVTLIHNPTYVYPNQYVLDADKYAFLSAADPQHVLTDGSTPDDYSVLVSKGPFDLPPGSSTEFAFAIVGGPSLAGLGQNADAAEAVYQGYVSDVPDGAEVITTTRLLLNAPNPFSESTSLFFELAQTERVQMDIYDVAGRKVRRLISESLLPGAHQVAWDGQDDAGHRVESGTYFVRMQGGATRDTRTILLLR